MCGVNIILDVCLKPLNQEKVMVQEKLLEIEEQIQKLQEKKKNIEQKRNDELSKLMAKIGLANIENEILAGAFLYIREKLAASNNEQDKVVGGWKESGKSFLKPKQRNKNSN
jgi:hypothetical protein